ncbi:MAG: PEP-CTERM sorting domain-containing protein, partial [Ktedonobacteraceae bacterium]
DFIQELHDALINAQYGTIATQIVDTGALTSLENSLATFNYSTAMQNNNQAPAVPNSGIAMLNGQTLNTQGDQLINIGSIVGNGTIQTGGLQNIGTISLDGGTTQVSGEVSNFGQLTVSDGQATFDDVTNNGHVSVSGSTVSYLGTFMNNGAYSSDPSTNEFNNLQVGQGGYLTGSPDDLFSLSGSFDNQSTQNTLWNTMLSTLAFIGPGLHEFDLAGEDFGATLFGYQNNFAWGALDLSGLSGELVLGSGNPDFTDALYVDGILGADITNGVIANILGDGLNIYYLTEDPANAYFDGQQYALENGGYLIPVSSAAVPEPSSLALFLTGVIGILFLAGRGEPRRN